MIKLAIIGCDIGYTSSPEVHAVISRELGLQLRFEVCDTSVDGFGGTVKRLLETSDGFFVTKPYKNDIKRYLNSVSTAAGVNAVRCLDGAGFNTDGVGFIYALDGAFPDWRDKVKNALVLGAGGAAQSVTEALKSCGKSVYVLNRNQVHAAKLCNAFGAELYFNQPAELIVNCTSAGRHGEDILKSLCVLPEFEYAFDLIYGVETPFLTRTKQSGAKASDGKSMLVYQAIEGDKIITGLDFDTHELFEKIIGKLDGKI